MTSISRKAKQGDGGKPLVKGWWSGDGRGVDGPGEEPTLDRYQIVPRSGQNLELGSVLRSGGMQDAVSNNEGEASGEGEAGQGEVRGQG